MSLEPEILRYWDWRIEQLKFYGLLLQACGLVAFLSLWWHQDRAWKYISRLLIPYFILLGVLNYGQWVYFGLTSPSPVPSMRAFIIRVGITGFLVCFTAVVLLIIDIRSRVKHFNRFSPEEWNQTPPVTWQWFGLIISLICLWSPISTSPGTFLLIKFTYGFPTSFGVTPAPTILFFAGLMLAASDHPPKAVLYISSVLAALSTLLMHPVSFNAILYIALAMIIFLGGLQSRAQVNPVEQSQ